MVTVAEFKSQYAEFSVADGLIQRAITTAENIWSLSDEGTGLVAAHLLALHSDQQAEPDGGLGIVKSERIGPRQVAYQNQARDNPDVFFATTPYGRLFLTLRDHTPVWVIGAVVVG